MRSSYLGVIIAFPLLFLAALFLFIFKVALAPADGRPRDKARTPEFEQEVEKSRETGQEVGAAEEQFWTEVEKVAPRYDSVKYSCPVDGTELAVPSRKQNNGLGGIASDLMKLAIARPETMIGPPKLDVQEWQLALASCPSCGATYMEVDLVNLRDGARFPGAEVKVKSFELAALAPALAARPQEEWTDDERNFAHYLTLREAGYPESELGFAALQCAYASNFAVWYGSDEARAYRVPSAAYYALAAAHLRNAVEEGPQANPRAFAATAMTCGELYRLLGRQDEAAAMFAIAQAEFDRSPEDSPMRKYEAPALAKLRGFLDSGSSALEHMDMGDGRAPLIGWYIEMMLPGINGHIDEFRGEWNMLDDADVILAEINEKLK